MDEYMELLVAELWQFNYVALAKNLLFYTLLVVCATQTFYPILMIMAMVVRQLGIFAHLFHKVDERSLRHGGELVAQVLKAHGVQHVFTLSGGHISPILVAAEKEGLRVIDTRSEVTAVFAADAVSRLSGVPGVAVVTAGPGLTNTITAVKNAQMAESPLLLLSGCAASLLRGRGALQDIDQVSVVKSMTKWQTTITKVRDIVPTLREAFRRSQTGTPGPVFVEFPLDVLYPYSLVQKEMLGVSGSVTSNTIRGKIMNWYLKNYMANLFAGAFDVEREVKPWPVEIAFPKSNQIKRTIELLKSAKRPLLVMGSQSMLPPIEADDLRRCLEYLGIPVYLGGMSRGLLGADSPLHFRQNRKDAMKEADLIILAGAIPDFRMSYGRILTKNAKIIAVNRSKENLYKNSDLFWKPTEAFQCDVGQFLFELVDALKKQDITPEVDTEWLKKLRQRDSEKEQKTAEISKQTGDHLNPVRVLEQLNETLGDNSIIVADGGDFVATSSYIVKPRRPLSWLDPGAYGTLGCGAGFALGAKLVRPDADVYILYGDGSLGYSLIEFDTFVRHKLPVAGIVGNDACWQQIAREQKPMLGSDVACRLNYSNYEKAVEALGGKGYIVDREDDPKLKETFQKALEQTRGPNGKPVLVNCLIGKTSFRDGSLSV